MLAAEYLLLQLVSRCADGLVGGPGLRALLPLARRRVAMRYPFEASLLPAAVVLRGNTVQGTHTQQIHGGACVILLLTAGVSRCCRVYSRSGEAVLGTLTLNIINCPEPSPLRQGDSRLEVIQRPQGNYCCAKVPFHTHVCRTGIAVSFFNSACRLREQLGACSLPAALSNTTCCDLLKGFVVGV